MWGSILELIPKWSVIFQGFMIFFVPFILIRTTSWARAKEDTISTRAKKAAGSIGGGVPYGETSIGTSGTKKVAKPDGSADLSEGPTGASYSGQFREDLQRFKEMSTDMHDVSFRELRIGGIKLQAALIFVDGLTDKDKMDRNILKPLMDAYQVFKDPHTIPEAKDLKDILIHEIVLISEVEFTDNVKLSLQKVLFGSVVLLVEGIPEAIVLSTPKGNTRGIEEPESEAVLRGSRS